MIRDREAATHGRRLSHVAKASRKAGANKAAVASGSPAAAPSASAK
jgi:hypothetical protein